MIKFSVQWFKEQYPMPDFCGKVQFDTKDEARKFCKELEKAGVDHLWIISVRLDEDEDRWMPVEAIYSF